MPRKSELAEIKQMLLRVLRNQEKILKEERAQLAEEDIMEAEEEAQLEELKELEEDIQKDIKGSALGKITFQDFTKSLIGALFGILGHFAYHLGPKIAEHISMTRASLLYAASLIVAILFVYFAGFRKVERKYLSWLPMRVAVIYATSLIVIVGVLFLFGDLSLDTGFVEAYKTVSTISLLAVLGASAADLIGKEV